MIMYRPLVRNERNVRDVRNALHYINDNMKEETDWEEVVKVNHL